MFYRLRYWWYRIVWLRAYLAWHSIRYRVRRLYWRISDRLMFLRWDLRRWLGMIGRHDVLAEAIYWHSARHDGWQDPEPDAGHCQRPDHDCHDAASTGWQYCGCNCGDCHAAIIRELATA